MVQKAKKAQNNIIVSQILLRDLDVQEWRSAKKLARQKIYPRRYKLYDICKDLLDEGHVYSVVDKRRDKIILSPVQFIRDNKPDDAINAQLNAPWFLDFLTDLWDTRLFGFSLFQFYRDGDWIGYDLIERNNVVPEERIILERQENNIGESWDNYPNMLAAGKPHDLGLLNKIAPYAIYMRNGLADNAQFVELFGQPIREGTYDGNDEEARTKLLGDLIEMGGSAVIVHPDGTKINLHEVSNTGNSAALYKTFLDILKSIISTIVLGNTLTTNTEKNGNRSLGEVHQESEEDKEKADRLFILNVLNYNLSDIFKNLGFNTDGGSFVFVDEEHFDLSVDIKIDTALNELGVPLDDDYFYKKYRRPKPENYEALKKEIAAKKAQPNNSQSFQNQLDDDFRFSPDKRRHINVKPSNLWTKGLDFFD